MGGPVPLGYQVQDRKLVIVEEEAQRVRLIFDRALACRSLPALVQDLRERGVVTKVTAMADGARRGGIPLTMGPLTYLLANRTYLGELVHKRTWHKGEHPPIISNETFDAVHAKLTQRRTAFWSARPGSAALLMGLIFDDRGRRMTPASARKKGVRYRYYVARGGTAGDWDKAGSVARVSAPDIEAAVIAALRDWQRTALPASDTDTAIDDRELVRGYLDRVIVKADELEITIKAAEGHAATISVAWSQSRNRVRREILMPERRRSTILEPMRADTRMTLLVAIAKARAWADAMMSGRARDLDKIALAEGRTARQVRMQLPLAFLAPDVIEAVLEHRLAEGFGVARFMAELPVTWDEQRRWIGLPPR